MKQSKGADELASILTGMANVLVSPELVLRVKRRVGPSLWPAVMPVLKATMDALKTLGRPDPYDRAEATIKRRLGSSK